MKGEVSKSLAQSASSVGVDTPKHTPGPWVMDWATDDVYTVYQPDLPHGDTRTVAYTGDYASEENRANARLIAAAPELLEALENLIRERPYFAPTVSDLRKAEAAIAKAKGEA